MPTKVLELRKSSTRAGWRKFKGRSTKFPSSPQTDRMEAEVREINEFLADYHIENANHYGFKRTFNNGDDPANYTWDQGGRLYSLGGESYQHLSPENRQMITIDGRPVVEVDITASHLTIYHGLLRQPFDPKASDPYTLPGLPRSVVKAWLLSAFGAGKFPQQWPSKAVSDYQKVSGKRNLGKVYPVRDVQAAILEKYPALRGFETSDVDGFYMVFKESEVIIKTMLDLKRNHDIPSLPVHDSLIVPEGDQEVVMETLFRNYEAKVGLGPALKVN